MTQIYKIYTSVKRLFTKNQLLLILTPFLLLCHPVAGAMPTGSVAPSMELSAATKEATATLSEKTADKSSELRADGRKTSTSESLQLDMDIRRLGADSQFGVAQRAPYIALKTNLLSWATATFNLGIELRLGKKLTLDVPFSLNPWTFGENKKWKHVMLKPELRIWGHEAFNKHFFGINFLYANYNIGHINLPLGIWDDLEHHRYEGALYGGGVSVGNQWILGNKWSLEATFGVGYFYTHYKKRECQTCGPYVKRDNKHYIGPTKLGLSLIFIIK